MSLVQKYSVEVILNLTSFVLGLVIGIISFVYFPDPSKGNIGAYVGFLVGLFVTFSLTCWMLTLKSAIDTGEIRSLIAAHTQKQDRLIAELLQNISDQRPGIEIERRWSNVNELIKQAGKASYQDHAAKFLPNDFGYEVTGEEWSLSAYQRVWEQLVERQRQIQHAHSDRNIVARVTHSNDIGIWDDQGKAGASRAENLLDLQASFVQHGGIIVRLLLYQGEQPSEIYQQVQRKMEHIGIEARLCELKTDDEARFDFLWACTDEKNGDLHCVVKWFPGTGGLRLAGCEITGIADDEVRRLWRLFGGRSEKKDGEFAKIPDDRKTV